MGAGGELVRMSEQPFESEADLEAILAEHPELITDDLREGDAAPRWLLVSRQARVDSANWTNRWAVDILFLDEKAVPTLAEVKRGTNTSLRRGAVAQILDYAANAVLYWSAETLRARFVATWEERGRDPDTVLGEFLAGAEELDVFWRRADANLQAGRIRLVFAADEVPVELQRIVEFLRRQMQAASVFAVEVKRFEAAAHSSSVRPLARQTALRGRRHRAARAARRPR